MIEERIVAKLDDIPPGEGRVFDLDGCRIAVFRTRQGRVFATQAECPHLGGPLADGLLGETTLVCPLHEWSFDLTTGAAIAGGCGITTYPTRTTEDDRIALGIGAARS